MVLQAFTSEGDSMFTVSVAFYVSFLLSSSHKH